MVVQIDQILLLVLSQELIQQMANVQYTENMTEEQLDAMAGGETLRYQATSFGIMRNNKVPVYNFLI
jgi:THO complex subunit 2